MNGIYFNSSFIFVSLLLLERILLFLQKEMEKLENLNAAEDQVGLKILFNLSGNSACFAAPQLNKRSSIHRPVLQLQVKPDTLERVRHRTGSNGSVMVSRSTLRTLAAGDSAAYGKAVRLHSGRTLLGWRLELLGQLGGVYLLALPALCSRRVLLLQYHMSTVDVLNLSIAFFTSLQALSVTLNF